MGAVFSRRPIGGVGYTWSAYGGYIRSCATSIGWKGVHMVPKVALDVQHALYIGAALRFRAGAEPHHVCWCAGSEPGAGVERDLQ